MPDQQTLQFKKTEKTGKNQYVLEIGTDDAPQRLNLELLIGLAHRRSHRWLHRSFTPWRNGSRNPDSACTPLGAGLIEKKIISSWLAEPGARGEVNESESAGEGARRRWETSDGEHERESGEHGHRRTKQRSRFAFWFFMFCVHCKFKGLCPVVPFTSPLTAVSGSHGRPLHPNGILIEEIL